MHYLVEVTGKLMAADAANALEDVFIRVATELTHRVETAPTDASHFDGLRSQLAAAADKGMALVVFVS